MKDKQPFRWDRLNPRLPSVFSTQNGALDAYVRQELLSDIHCDTTSGLLARLLEPGLTGRPTYALGSALVTSAKRSSRPASESVRLRSQTRPDHGMP